MNIDFTQNGVILLMVLQIMLIPFVQYYLNQYKKDTINDCKDLIDKLDKRLNNLYDHNKDRLNYLESHLSHNEEIAKLNKENFLSRLNDIEVYLEKTNGFRRRHLK